MDVEWDANRSDQPRESRVTEKWGPLSCTLVHLLHPGRFKGVLQMVNFGLHPSNEVRSVRTTGSKRFVKALSEELRLRRV